MKHLPFLVTYLSDLIAVSMLNVDFKTSNTVALPHSAAADQKSPK